MSQSEMGLEELSILLVEPSHTQQRIIKHHLQELGLHMFDCVDNGETALAHVRDSAPDLVISAMYFEDMTAKELIETLRGSDYGAHVPFMLVSSETHHDNLESIRQAGVLAMLPKPFKAEDLRRALAASVDYLAPARLSAGTRPPEEMSILVVDDSRFSLRHIVHMLQQMGVQQIHQASNGREAAESLAEHTFDLVITDYNMPEMDGQQLVNYIRQLSDQPELPVLMVTSEQDDARLTSVRQAGVSAVCDKPFDTTTLRRMAAELLGE